MQKINDFMGLDSAERAGWLAELANEVVLAQFELSRFRVAHAAALIREVYPTATSVRVHAYCDATGRNPQMDIETVHDGDVLLWTGEFAYTPERHIPAERALGWEAGESLPEIGRFGLDLVRGVAIL